MRQTVEKPVKKNILLKRIFVTPIPNTKSESLIEGIGKMLQVKRNLTVN